MKDCFDVIQDVKSLINVPAITGQLTGAIWSDERPNSRSTKSDIVVNSNSITNTQIQVGRASIAVYWPNMKVAEKNAVVGGPDVISSMADQVNLYRMGRLILPLVETQSKSTFSTEVEDPGTVIKDADGSYFLNIRLVYRSVQENYKNI